MAQMICTDCGTAGKPKRHVPGSILIEIVAWCCLLVPGILYSLWRHSTTTKGCPACQGKMVPVTSPKGKRLLDEAGREAAVS